MRWHRFTVAAITIAVGLTNLAPPARAQDEEAPQPAESRSVFVGVESSGRPHVWHFDTGGYLGVELVDLTPELRRHFGVSEEAGVLVGSVVGDSPAAAAGLEVGDIITAIDGTPMTDRGTIARTVASRAAGDRVELELWRDGNRRQVTAEIEERERPQLLLGRAGEGTSYAFQWRSDEHGNAVLAVPTPGEPMPDLPALGEVPPVLHPERLAEIMARLDERLESPEFQARMLEVRTNTERLERRIRELEERLRELSTKLEELER